MVSPGAVATELPESSSEEASGKNLREFYKMAIPANSIASAIAYAIEQPPEMEIEMVIRPTAQDFLDRVKATTMACSRGHSISFQGATKRW